MLPTTYDSVFNRHRRRLPLNFMKALAKKESDFNAGNTREPAWGLMQVVEVVRNSWNKRKPDQYVARQELLDPDTNVKIAADLLNRIVVAYGKHPDPNMKQNWSNPEFVKLVLAGWNSGYSEAAGVGRVASYLEERGIPVTHDNVFRYAGPAGGTRHLQNDAKRRWQAGVASLYFAAGGPDQSILPRLLISGALGYLIYTVYTYTRS